MAVNKMDWQKNILMAAILAVLFMLAIRWNNYQDAHSPVTTTTSSSSINTSDIPTPASSLVVESTTAVSTASINTIKVVTDSLIVDISPIGGDIIKVALPKHSENLSTPEIPFVLIDNTTDKTYIAQSGIVGVNGTDNAQGRPTYSVEKSEFILEKNENKIIVDLHLQQGQIEITKRFTFTRGNYLISMEYIINNRSDAVWSGQLYGQIKRDSKVVKTTSGGIGMSPYLGGAIHTTEANYKKITFDDLKKSPFETTEKGGWVSLVQHYFISAWIPDADSTNNFKLRKFGDKDLYLFGFTSNAVEVVPNSQGSLKASFYAGPKDTEALEKISPFLDLTVDYGWLWMIAKPLFWLLKYIHSAIGNWGLAIIGLTLAVKALFYKLSATSYRSMAKMKKLAPKMAEMKERYGDDHKK
jgi:YidC/Oxa1 family membrane protein insertase